MSNTRVIKFVDLLYSDQLEKIEDFYKKSTEDDKILINSYLDNLSWKIIIQHCELTHEITSESVIGDGDFIFNHTCDDCYRTVLNGKGSDHIHRFLSRAPLINLELVYDKSGRYLIPIDFAFDQMKDHNNILALAHIHIVEAPDSNDMKWVQTNTFSTLDGVTCAFYRLKN